MRLLITTLSALFVLSGCANLADWIPWRSTTENEVREDPVSPEGDTEALENAFPIQAGSWGGKVRSGPGMEYAHVTSLREGDPVVLLSVSDVSMNGYPWFHIRYGSEHEGFKWGGILCAQDVWVEGLYNHCTQSVSSNLRTEVRPNGHASALEQIRMSLDLLPGRWMSTTDSNSIIVFGHDRETHDLYDGVKVTAGSWTLEEYGASPTNVTLRRTVDGNFNVYSVLLLNSEELVLSFLPRGNTLSYKRIE